MIKLIGDHITDYYQGTRGVGHTQAMIDGVGDRSIVVVANHRQIKALTDLTLAQHVFPVYDINEKLRGLRLPLHIDNHAFTMIWAEGREALDSAERRITELERKLGKV